ncbi:hypothetical protein LTR56_007257 [Elasticomyces elasticus]|nr:hypothetical protein LTR56_007257 [Elasticomyces elasticus]KAK3663011.1 hypothetical protein LTR22_006175 [Elasticomyces elasticus]KAK4918873.1 hypothetical protein LTR49_013345 [Elasticomyces elasticus]KAK5740734.1 hypothetical protein LTS12_024825 [Elasticomyces elasticus]
MAIMDVPELSVKARTHVLRKRAPTVEDEMKPEATETDLTSFNFFGLPKELRDLIYDFSLIYKRKIRSQHGARLRGRRVPEPSLVLVSKQVHHEYLQRAEHHTCLVIVDRPEFHGDPFRIPSAISYARNVELYLAIACDAPDHFTDQCRVVKEVRMHRKWIAQLSQKMRHLLSIKIHLIIDPHHHIEACEAKLLELQYMLTGFEELKALEVYHCDYAGKAMGWSFAGKRTLVMEWSEEHRELRRMGAVGAVSDVMKQKMSFSA